MCVSYQFIVIVGIENITFLFLIVTRPHHCYRKGLVTYREVDLLIDEVKASSSQKQQVCTVVTHE